VGQYRGGDRQQLLCSQAAETLDGGAEAPRPFSAVAKEEEGRQDAEADLDDRFAHAHAEAEQRVQCGVEVRLELSGPAGAETLEFDPRHIWADDGLLGHPGGRAGGPCRSSTATMLPTFATLSASPAPAAASGRMKIAATSRVMKKAARLRRPFSRRTTHA
jgi:hypothetical protein